MNEIAREMLLRGALELGVGLRPEDLGRFYSFAAELKKWGKKINLTAIHEDEEIVVKHFLDSLTLVKVISNHGRLLDIGSGAGFPAIPIKIIHHGLQVTTVDCVEKKVIFQRHAARLLGLNGFEALHARGEELPGTYACCFDWIVSRAFSDISTFARMALPLLARHGRIVAMKGRSGNEEMVAAQSSLRDLGLRAHKIVSFDLPVSGDNRSLIVLEQTVS